MADIKVSPNQFFKELLNETEKQFKISPIYKRQLDNKKNWNYAICATPIIESKGVILGLNWGGDDVNAQIEMPTGKEIFYWPFIKSCKIYLESWGIDFSTLDFNYTNLCFFRSPVEKLLSNDDYRLSLPLVKKFVHYINPPWILSIGVKSVDKLMKFNQIRNIKTHFDKEHKYKGYSGLLWDYNFFSVPHPSTHMTNNARQTIWRSVICEMNKIKNS